MTIAEQLRQEGEKQDIWKGREEGIHLGEQRGIEKGIQLGKQKGETNGSVKIARQLLGNGVDRAIVKMSIGLSDTEINTLMN